FTNLIGNKLRPAVILYKTELDFTACFITSKTDWQEPTDLLLFPSQLNGLRKTSIVRTSKIATIDRELASGLLGKLDQDELSELDLKLKLLLQLT
ncbi:MAG: type II toxin-antitoxin system PemK/MazF family toxin, partial [Saprospiraceae bacterium]